MPGPDNPGSFSNSVSYLSVVFAGASTGADMHTGALSIGSPEMALNTAATAQMARFYGLPVRSGGAICDAKYPDAQAASE